MKIGDKVRFLSSLGGGVVAGFQGKDIVLVEDEDGFQIPTRINDVVPVQSDDYSSRATVTAKMRQQEEKQKAVRDGRSIRAMMRDGQDEEEASFDFDAYDVTDPEGTVTFKPKPEERKGGNMLTACIAFVPMDITSMSSTRFELYFVNDSNYHVTYSLQTAEGASWTLLSQGTVEPNTKELLQEVGREDLDALSKVCVQMFAYKADKPFILKPAVDVQFRIDPVKFFKLHTFTDNIYFESPALIFNIVENDVPVRSLVVDAKQLKRSMYKDSDDAHDAIVTHREKSNDTYVRRYDNGGKKGNPFISKRKGDEDVVVVDLHAGSLLDTTAGMSPTDILNYQLAKFREVLASYKNKKGQKIVFIHGKGEGVLRRALVNDLHYRYKSYTYQDASFQEYGYGATQVTIR